MLRKSDLRLVIGVQVYHSSFLLTRDESKHELWNRFAKIWTLALEALAEQMVRYFPDEEQLARFVEAVKKDVQNKDYQLYAYTFIPKVSHLIVDISLSAENRTC